MVDIGGASGSEVSDFKTQFPHLPGRLILQDPHASLLTDATKHPQGVEVMTYDFFTPKLING
jgi:demethylsterigmatocystin 6-O-methyltransferase